MHRNYSFYEPTSLKKVQTATIAIALIAIIAINLPYVFPRFYKGVQHDVGSKTVSVYVFDSDLHALSVPVIDPNKNFAETGQRVSVFLRNNYRDDEIQHPPRLTLAILLGFTIFYVIITRVGKKPSSNPPA